MKPDEIVETLIGDSRFFARSGPHSLAAIAAAANAETPNLDLSFDGIAPLQVARKNEVTFLDNPRYAAMLKDSCAGAVIVHPDMKNHVPSNMVQIITPEPYEAWARVAALFHPLAPISPGIHPSAVIAKDAYIHSSAEIGPFCVIGSGAKIGSNCRLEASVIIGRNVVIGSDCRIGANASISHALIGSRVYVYCGARIGQEGFGFAATKTGFLSVPQLGRVILEDDVEIGANSTIDRGSARDTIIGAGSRIDNLVQIAHNVTLGRCCIIVAQAGIAGSTALEDFVRVGGQAAMAGHLRIGKGAQIAAQSGVMADVNDGAVLMGTPAQPKREFFRQIAMLKRLKK